ncbi:hypothetical protein L218DRAFT_861741 [Marasmius fiardii PR-910]|nr:hypothetical protein L218DRAFT_861741 [Marasmius fiardii PR-910]
MSDGNSILKIGNQCATCPQVDFLPIRCDCDKYFCKDHISPDAHDCVLLADKVLVDFDSKLQRCHLELCNKPSLNLSSDPSAACCSHCGHSFCAEHRHQSAHHCTAHPPVRAKNEAARALLTKHFPSTSSQSPKVSTTPSNTTQLNTVKSGQFQKLEAMKMRHKAIPVDPQDKATVPVNQRRFVKARIDGAGEEKIYWTRKTITTGKVFDLLATGLGIPTSKLNHYRLYKSEGNERVPLRNDKFFADEADDGSLLVFVPQ